MAASRKKSTGRKRARSVKKNPVNKEIYFLLGMGCLVLLCLSNFGLVGPVGRGIKWFFFGLIGIMEYIFPFLLAFNLIYYASKDKIDGSTKIKFAALYSLMILISAIWQRVYNKPPVFSTSVGKYFLASAEEKNGGGVIGGLIVKILSPTGLVGSILILLVLAVICVVIMTEWSVRKTVSQAREKGIAAAENMKKDYEEYSQNADETRLKRETARAEREERIRKRREEKEARRQEILAAKEAEKQAESRRQPAPSESSLSDEELPLPRMERKIRGVGNTSLTGYKAGSTKPGEDDVEEKALYGVQDDPAGERINAGFADIFADTLSSDSDMINDNDNKEMYNDTDQGEDYPGLNAGKDVEEAMPEGPVPSALTQTLSPASDRIAKPAGENRVHAGVSVSKEYKYPPLDLLNKVKTSTSGAKKQENRETAILLKQTLENFGVNVKITDISCGPAVTRFELQPEMGVKVSKIVGLADDIKLNLAAEDIRIEAPIPGKAAIGIEVPNKNPGSVSLRELIESKAFQEHISLISFAVGEDIAGQPVMADIAKMPHVLIAGATGSGKSVCINGLIMSVLYKARPDQVKMIMIDPKVVELSAYNGIPHLLIPVVTDPKKASGALNWAVAEMDSRYKKFAAVGAKNLNDYNVRVKERHLEEEGHYPMPQLLVIIDELADLMMVAPGEVETAICRLAQLARAAGIHLVIATQRPSVNVITGLIKANVPSRIAFAVSSGVDSRTIIDMNGAEKLLGKGDMLFFPTGIPKPVRVQGAFVSDEEVARVVDFLKENNDQEGPEADQEEIEKITQTAANFPGAPGGTVDSGDERDILFAEAGRFVIEKERGSIGMLQRNFKIGFNRAGRIMDQLTDLGVVGPEVGTKPRKVLMTMDEFEEFLRGMD